MLRNILSCFADLKPNFGFHINLFKYKLYWPWGNSTYSAVISCIDTDSGAGFRASCLSFFGALFQFFDSLNLSDCFSVQVKLALLQDSQVEHHLLRSSQSVCKAASLPLLVLFYHILTSVWVGSWAVVFLIMVGYSANSAFLWFCKISLL